MVGSTSIVLNHHKPYCGRAVYGFVMYLLSNSLLLLYFAWALLPDSYLQVRHREINWITFTGSTSTVPKKRPTVNFRVTDTGQTGMDPHYILEADPDPDLR